MPLLKKHFHVILFAILAGIANIAFAQETSNVKFGKISAEDFNLQGVDTSKGAVIIADIGSTNFVGSIKGWFRHVYKRYTRVKILNDNAFNTATQHIFLYSKDQENETLSDVAATTYTLENGRIIQTSLDKKDIFEDRYNKNYTEKKFTLPAVKAGSIIEYAYTITSDFDFRLHAWEFQSTEYPCLWSEYNVSIPNLLIYASVRQGFDSFYINKSSVVRKNYLITQKGLYNPAYGEEDQDVNVGTLTNNRRWVMKNVPPLKLESYVSSPKNYIDKIEFQLYQTSNGDKTRDVITTWGNASHELLDRQDFGKPLMDPSQWLNDKVKELSANNADLLTYSQNVFYYIRNNFNCNSYNNFYIKTSLNNVFTAQNGNVGEINLLLILLLSQKGIIAEPVLLSTRENGFNFPKYPVLDKFNYLICRAKIDDKVYYLDCSHKQLGFGLLAGNCYNGQARVVNEDQPDSIIFSADSVKEQKVALVTISNTEEGVLEGSVKQTPGMLESYNIRGAFAASQAGDSLKILKDYCPVDIPVSGLSIDSLKRSEFPVSLNYNFKLSTNAESVFYFNPFMFQVFPKNPFTAGTRAYPVELPYCIQDAYILNMEVPKGFKIDEMPKSVRIKLGEADGQFEYIAVVNNNRIQLRCTLMLNKANFEAGDYETLRDFFTAVVKKQSEQIVFKKL